MEHYTRISDFLKSYWDELRGDKPLPSEVDINPDAFGDIWHDCFMVQITPVGEFRYDYLGDNIIDAYGDDMSREHADLLLSPMALQVAEQLEVVRKTEEIVYNKGEFCNSTHMFIRYRQILLPFTSIKVDERQGDVTHILGGMRWKML